MIMRPNIIPQSQHTARSVISNNIKATSSDEAANRSLQGKEAARFLGLSHKTLNNWRVQGVGPRFVKASGANGSVRYPLSELVAWRDAHLKSSTSQGEG